MSDLVLSSIFTHNMGIFFILALITYHYYAISTSKSFIQIARKLKITTPIFHLFNAFIIYSGALVAAYSREFSWTVLLMIGASIFLMVSEIKRYKKMRIIRTIDFDLQEDFKVFAKKIYYYQILVICLVFIISKVF